MIVKLDLYQKTKDLARNAITMSSLTASLDAQNAAIIMELFVPNAILKNVPSVKEPYL